MPIRSASSARRRSTRSARRRAARTIGECWALGTATFMILGSVCTRNCGFCAIDTGRPPITDVDEPRRVAEATHQMGLKHVVVTMVARDDLPDGGARMVAETIRQIRLANPGTSIEVLISDLNGRQRGHPHGRRGAAGHPQPQRRDGAPAPEARSSPRPLGSVRLRPDARAGRSPTRSASTAW